MNLTLQELIEQYKQMALICHNIDYADMKTVKANNKAVDKMYQIVDKVRTIFGDNGVAEFAKLMDFKQYRINIWAAIQMLEKMQVDSNTENKALAIIQEEAKNSLGHQYWLKSYQEKKKNATS